MGFRSASNFLKELQVILKVQTFMNIFLINLTSYHLEPSKCFSSKMHNIELMLFQKQNKTIVLSPPFLKSKYLDCEVIEPLFILYY